LVAQKKSWWVNNPGLYMFAISLSETKCLQGGLDLELVGKEIDLRSTVAGAKVQG